MPFHTLIVFLQIRSRIELKGLFNDPMNLNDWFGLFLFPHFSKSNFNSRKVCLNWIQLRTKLRNIHNRNIFLSVILLHIFNTIHLQFSHNHNPASLDLFQQSVNNWKRILHSYCTLLYSQINDPCYRCSRNYWSIIRISRTSQVLMLRYFDPAFAGHHSSLKYCGAHKE